MKTSRKVFLKTLGLTGAALALPVTIDAANTQREIVPFKLGLASYTFRKFSLDDTIQFMKQLGLERVALKSFHLPLDARPEEIQAAARKVRDAGIDLYGAGVIYMKTEAEVTNTFEYARNAGLKMIIGVPNHELLPLVEKKVKEYNIQVAIHNHGPGDLLYSSPTDAWNKIKDLDPRIGLCLDIGHAVRIKQDPAALARLYKQRLFDCHIKDVKEVSTEDKAVEIGRGIIDIPAFLNVLIKIGYTGSVSFEYEKDEMDPLPGLAESVGYVRGVLKMCS